MKYKKLRVLLLERNISLRKLGLQIKIDGSYLSKKFRGVIGFTEKDITKICEYLEICPCEYFFTPKLQKMHKDNMKIAN